MKIRSLYVAILVLLPSAVQVRAQTPDAQRRVQLIEQLTPGTLVRILTGSDTMIGRVQRVSNDTLYIDQSLIAASSIDNAWIQQRSTRKGMKIGALIGAPAGAAFGAFLFTLATGLCQYECTDDAGRAIVLGTIGFGAAGLVSGGALGAVIGAAIPRWVEITKAPVKPDKLARANSPRIGSLSLTPAYARFASDDENGGGARFAYMFHTRHISLGPELGRYGMGDRRVAHAGGIVRVGTGNDRTIEPFANVGFGLYSWSLANGGGAIQLGGYSLGGGAQVRSSRGRLSAFAEGRWQSNLTHSGDMNPQYGFYTVGIGGSVAW